MNTYLNLFRTRRDYCVALRELSREQRNHIDEDNYTELLVLLGRKQHLLGRMEELSKAQPRLWVRWREDREQLASDDRNACEAVLEETERILADLQELEVTSTDELTRRRNATREQLHAANQGGRAQSAYQDDNLRTSRRLDVGQ